MRSKSNITTLQAILLLFISNFLSRVIGFVRVMIFAQYVGTECGAADAYAFSFLLPEILNHLLAGSALSITFIPIYQRLSRDGDGGEWHFFSNLFVIGSLIFIISIALSLIFTENFVRLMAGSEYPEELLPMTVRLTRIIVPAQLFFFWGALFNGVQYAHKQFSLPALNPLIYNIGIICGGVLLQPIIGVEGFSWGVLLGAFVGNVVLGGYGVWKLGGRVVPSLKASSSPLLEWLIKTLPLMLGLGFTFSTEFLIRFFGARGEQSGEGAIAALDYGFRIFMMLVALFGHSIAAGSYPFISSLATDNRVKQAEDTIFSLLVKIAAILFTSSLLLAVVGEDLIAILFERRAFTSESTKITSQAFIGYLPGAFFFAATLILNRLYYAFGMTITPLVLSTLSLLLAWPLFLLFSSLWGVGGIAFATAVFSFVTFVSLLSYWKYKYPESEVKRLLLSLFKVSIPAIIGGAISFFIHQYTNGMNSIIRVAISLAIPLIPVVFLYVKMEILSIRQLKDRLSGRFKSKRA